MRRTATLLMVLALVAAACGDDDASTTTQASDSTQATSDAGPAMGPAEVVFEAQDSDGTTITVASITLPSPGYIAVHGNLDGGPGPVIGHSDLLPAGTSTNVVVTLDEPLGATDMVFPMAHIDVNGNGEYEFMPPDIAFDLPATTADGGIAVVGALVTVG